MRFTQAITAAALLVCAGCAATPPAPTEADADLRQRLARLEERSEDLAQQIAEARREREEAEQELAELRRRLEAKPAPRASASSVAERPPAGEAPVPAPAANPYQFAKSWVDDAMQVQDGAKREAAIASIRDALAGDDPVRVTAALVAVPQIAKLNYDKAPMRDLVLRHAGAADAGVRAALPFALLNAGGTRPSDVETVLALTTDAAAPVRGNAGRSLVFFTKYDLTGPAGERVLALLDDPDRQVRREVLRSIWGSKVSPGIEARLLEMFRSEDRQVRHDAFYFGLSTLPEKSPAVVGACVAAMESTDHELQWRARWGLSQGVPDDQCGTVGDAYLTLLSARSDSQLEQDAFQWLQRHGTTAHAERLEELARNPLVAEATQKAARETAAAVRSRAPR